MSKTVTGPTIPTLFVSNAATHGLDVKSCEFALETRAARPDDAVAVLAGQPDLGLVVIDAALGESGGAAVVHELRRKDPGLPIVWYGPDPVSLTKFGAVPPDRILMSADPETLARAVTDLLRLRVYSPPILRALWTAAERVLIDGFRTQPIAHRTFLRANQLALAEHNAILPFAGATFAGFCLVSASADALTAIRARTLGDHSEHAPATSTDIQDVAGEMSNHVVGQLKPWFLLQGLKVNNGCPIVVSGKNCTIREKGGAPAAVVAVNVGPSDQVFVQLSLDAAHVLELKRPELELSPTEGRIEFLA